MRLLLFKKVGCAPCAAFTPEAEALAHEAGVELEVVDIADQPELVASCKVRAVPTLIVANEHGVRLAGWIPGNYDRTVVLRVLGR